MNCPVMNSLRMKCPLLGQFKRHTCWRPLVWRQRQCPFRPLWCRCQAHPVWTGVRDSGTGCPFWCSKTDTNKCLRVPAQKIANKVFVWGWGRLAQRESDHFVKYYYGKSTLDSVERVFFTCKRHNNVQHQYFDNIYLENNAIYWRVILQSLFWKKGTTVSWTNWLLWLYRWGQRYSTTAIIYITKTYY